MEIETIERSVVGGSVMKRQSTENFKGRENTLYDPVLMGMCHYTFAQIHRIYKSMSEP